MLLWVLLLVGMALATALVMLFFAMRRADRRARRVLFHTLGMTEETVDLLMARNSDVVSALALVRRTHGAHAASGGAEDPTIASETKPGRGGPNLRLVRPLNDAAPEAGEGRQPLSDRLSNPGRPGRH